MKLSRIRASRLLRLWKSITSLSVDEITSEAERPFSIALIGSVDQTDALADRLARDISAPPDSPRAFADISPYVTRHLYSQSAPPEALHLDASAANLDETALAATLARIVVSHRPLRLALARHIPAFRPAVVAQLIGETSWTNAKIATFSAIPAVIPFADIFMPATAVGDMLLLTKNQGTMLLRIAAAYGLPIDLRVRTRELLPVVGSAFGWRALARELVGLVPGGVGLVFKGSIAYAGTYTVGKTAQIYYTTGHVLAPNRLKQLGADAAKEARCRIRQWLRRERHGNRGISAWNARQQEAPDAPLLSASNGRLEPDFAQSDADIPIFNPASLDNSAKTAV